MGYTELWYLRRPTTYTTVATLLSAEAIDDRLCVVLDHTPFYPQGGGQPSDTGSITASGMSFRVEQALIRDGMVEHLGQLIAGWPRAGPVTVSIDAQTRAAHSRLHSAGHLIVAAMSSLASCEVRRGFHFPQGAYVEFSGRVPAGDRPAFAHALQQRVDTMIARGEKIVCEVSRAPGLSKRSARGRGDREELTQVVGICGYTARCCGTHVARTDALAGLRIFTIRTKGDGTRVSYGFGCDQSLSRLWSSC